MSKTPLCSTGRMPSRSQSPPSRLTISLKRTSPMFFPVVRSNRSVRWRTARELPCRRAPQGDASAIASHSVLSFVLFRTLIESSFHCCGTVPDCHMFLRSGRMEISKEHLVSVESKLDEFQRTVVRAYSCPVCQCRNRLLNLRHRKHDVQRNVHRPDTDLADHPRVNGR